MMENVSRDIDRALTLLRNKIREKGLTQLEVQESLSWGRSYISQLFTRQKALRLEQILLILNVIEAEPAEFFSELYHYSPRPEAASFDDAGDTRELEALLRGLVQLLTDQGILDEEDLLEVAGGSAGRRAP